MYLPNREQAYIPERKITGYLLAITHPIGGPKARFFRSFGFNDSNTELLIEALLGVAILNEVYQAKPGIRGTLYVILGTIRTPIGRSIDVQTIWIIEKDGNIPRFVTAYPQ